MLKKIIIFTLILSAISSFGQNFKEEKRIYVLDITGSMFGAGGAATIFDEVKNSLIETINALDDPSTDITVITFGKQTKDKWHAKASKDGKKDLISKINTIVYNKTKPDQLQQATNICAALEAANTEIDIEKFNYLFLYTDGGHNFPNQNLDCVRNIVDEICAKSRRPNNDVYPFYIMLTDNANSPELRNSLNCFTHKPPCGGGIYIDIVRPENTQSSINLLENKLSTDIRFVSNRNDSLPGQSKLKVSLERNDFFTLDRTEYDLSPDLGSIIIKFVPTQNIDLIKASLPVHSNLKLSLDIKYSSSVAKCNSVEMRPNTIVIDVVNIREKTVTISVIDEEE